ncbi:hypothetical protein LZ086_13650 [Acinetobacter johnsonii]|nr:hypothetical protein LZ086_13650 [Acinetobacter johnsonii]
MSVKKTTSFKMDTLSYSALASALLCVQQSYAAMPMAGETIQNIAYASYAISDENGGQLLLKTQSNPVNVTVSEFYGLQLHADTLKQVEAGSKVIWLNSLANLSNTEAWIDFTTLPNADLSNIKVYLDANDDGVFNVSEILITNGLLLQPNQNVHLWIVADTSTQTADQAFVDLPLTAHMREQPEVQDVAKNPAQVIQPKLKIEKSVDQTILQSNQQAQTIQYTLNVSNAALLPILPTQVKVDGQTESLVIVEDPLPANTVFESVEVLEKTKMLSFYIV